jgi:hypothetical protein
MADNSVLTPSIVTNETLVILENNLVMAGKVNRQTESSFVKIGATITVRKPNRYTVTKGPGLQIQNVTEPSTSLTVSNQRQVAFQFNSADLTLTIEEFSERYLKTAAAALANQLDIDVMTNYVNIWNEVGTPGVIPASYSAIAAVAQRMDEGAVPQDGRILVLGPAAYWSVDNALISLYVRSVAEPSLKGYLANIANLEIYEDQNAPSQTVGNYSGTPVVNGANQVGSILVTNGWTASVMNLLLPGDVFVVNGVFAINPQSRQSTGQLQNFVVTAPVNSDGSGNASIPIAPAITIAGPPPGNPYQTVTVSPANLAPITVKGAANTTYPQSLGFVKDTFGLVVVPMEVPDGVDFGASQKYKNISLRIIRVYDVNNDVFPCRIDLLEGTSTFYPELGVRLTS